MGKVEGEGDGKTEGKCQDNPLIGTADGEHVFGERAECDGLMLLVAGQVGHGRKPYVRIERLNNLSGPDIRPLDRKQDFSLICRNRTHQRVVNHGAKHRPNDLNRERTSGT